MLQKPCDAVSMQKGLSEFYIFTDACGKVIETHGYEGKLTTKCDHRCSYYNVFYEYEDNKLKRVRYSLKN